MKHILSVLLLILLLFSAPVAAAENQTSEEDEDEGDTIVNIDLEEVVEAINDLATDFDSFSNSWNEALEDVLRSVFLVPFRVLMKFLVSELAAVLLHTPDVYPNPAVEEVHQQALLVTYLCAGLAFMIAGLLHMVGPILGISYQQVRMVFPRLIAALVFASFSLPLLQYMVDFSDALVYAFKPNGLQTSLGEMFGTSITLVLVWVINSWLLLAIVLIFIVRAVYLMFVAAISPLLALGWSLPKVKRYADSFIAGWFTALMMAPLDMLVLKFSFALMSGQGSTLTQSLANWLYGMAAAVLLIWVPYQLYGASQAAVGQAYVLTRSIKGRVKQHQQKKYRKKRFKQRQRAIEQRIPTGGYGMDRSGASRQRVKPNSDESRSDEGGD